MTKKINYIETTLNGYIIKRIEICKYEKGKDYMCDLNFNDDGVEIEYYDDICGDFDLLDEFLRKGTNEIEGYEKAIDEKSNIFLDSWHTLTTGFCTDRFIGLEIK